MSTFGYNVWLFTSNSTFFLLFMTLCLCFVYSKWFGERSDVTRCVVQSEHSTQWECQHWWLDAESCGRVAAANQLAAIRGTVYYAVCQWTDITAAGQHQDEGMNYCSTPSVHMTFIHDFDKVNKTWN